MQRHTAGCPAFEVRILYPFHPRSGETVVVLDSQRHAGSEHLAPEERERMLVGVEHHFLRLAWIGAREHHAAVTEADVRDLYGRRHPVHHDDLVAPVELIGLARREGQRHIGVRRLARVLLAPGPGVTANRVVTALVAERQQLLENPNERQPLARRLAVILQKQ